VMNNYVALMYATSRHVRHQPLVLLLGPRALVQRRLLAGRRPRHGFLAPVPVGRQQASELKQHSPAAETLVVRLVRGLLFLS
jgi:hypothetical protein